MHDIIACSEQERWILEIRLSSVYGNILLQINIQYADTFEFTIRDFIVISFVRLLIANYIVRNVPTCSTSNCPI